MDFKTKNVFTPRLVKSAAAPHNSRFGFYHNTLLFGGNHNRLSTITIPSPGDMTRLDLSPLSSPMKQTTGMICFAQVLLRSAPPAKSSATTLSYTRRFELSAKTSNYTKNIRSSAATQNYTFHIPIPFLTSFSHKSRAHGNPTTTANFTLQGACALLTLSLWRL